MESMEPRKVIFSGKVFFQSSVTRSVFFFANRPSGRMMEYPWESAGVSFRWDGSEPKILVIVDVM